MNEVPIENFPPAVWETYKDIVDRTEVEPVVYRNGFGCMILTHGNDRVQLTIKFKNNNKWSRHGSALVIDGKAAPLSIGLDHYASIFADPDNGWHTFTPVGARKKKLPKMRDLDEEQITYLPQQISRVLGPIRAAAENSESKLSIRMSEDSEYVICMEDPKTLCIYLFVGSEKGKWKLSRMSVINPSGYDVGSMYDGNLAEAMLKILGITSRKSQQSFTSEGATQSQAGTSNSVSVRKSTVFRV